MMGVVHEQTNNMSAAEILSRLNLQFAKDGKSYPCPDCDNGLHGDPRHGHGDGVKPYTKNGRTRWHCHRCGRDFSNFDWAAFNLGINPEHDGASAAKAVGELYNISDDRDFSFSRDKSGSVSGMDKMIRGENGGINLHAHGWDDVPAAIFDSDGNVYYEYGEKKSASTSEPKNYAKGLYKYCREHYSLKKFVDNQGGTWRGLTFDTLSNAGCLYHPDFMLSEDNKAPCVIVPYDDYHYLARAVEGKAKSKGGSNAGLYEPMSIKINGVNFIFEGEINALSAAQVLKTQESYFGCVATGSASNWDKVVPELNKRFGAVERKPAFIVIFDDDGANNPVSKEHARSLVVALNAAGYPAATFFFEVNTDANDLLVRGGDGELVGQLYDALDRGGVEIDEQRKKFAEQREAQTASAERERQAELNQSGSGTFSFAEYFASGQFDAYTSRSELYSSRKTGFENLDDGRLIFLPGLYVVGALPAVGKTTFCWQLVSNLAAAGEPVAYLTFEMSRHELFAKTVAREVFKRHRDVSEKLNLTNSTLRRGGGRAVAEVNQLIQEFGQSKMTLDVIEPSNMDVREIIARELKPRAANAGDKSLVVVVDYLQIMPSRADSAKAAVDDAVLRLKDFQRSTNATLIVISSFNRQNYWQPVSFESFKESGGIEFGADALFGLQYDVDFSTGKSGDDDGGIRDRVAKMSRQAERDVKLVCLKNRNGAPFDARFKYFAAFDYFVPVKEKEERSLKR